jgi:hypothetical protein
MADIFSYSFDTTAKNQTDNGNTADPDAARSDVSRSGDWLSNGNGWEVRSEAAYSGGTGLGSRHYRDGENGVSGGIRCNLSSSVTELWFRFYSRYESGFPWTPSGSPGYTKDIYGNQGGDWWIYGIQNTGWGVSFSSSQNHDGGGAYTWQDLMGGDTGDGLWHCHEFHIKKGNGSGEIHVWIDDVLRVTETGLSIGTGSMSDFIILENQSTVAGLNSWYVDCDEFKVSDSGRVGPISGGGGGGIIRGSMLGGLG